MKMLYVTDMHGDKAKYEKILDVALSQHIKLIVNGGDMLPKLGKRHEEQPRFINEYLRDYFRHLQVNGISYLAMLGNDDLKAVDDVFGRICAEFDNVHDITCKKVVIEGYEFIGMDSILDHPFGCKDRVVMEKNYIHQRQLSTVALLSNSIEYDRIYNWIEYSTTKLPHMCEILNSLPKTIHPDKTIYIMHMPPASLHLGQLYSQDLDIGSQDIYDFLKENQPLLSLHGHIHESPDTKKGRWMNQILNTTCIQPGQREFYDEEMIYAFIDLDQGIYERRIIELKK